MQNNLSNSHHVELDDTKPKVEILRNSSSELINHLGKIDEQLKNSLKRSPSQHDTALVVQRSSTGSHAPQVPAINLSSTTYILLKVAPTLMFAAVYFNLFTREEIKPTRKLMLCLLATGLHYRARQFVREKLDPQPITDNTELTPRHINLQHT